VLQLSRYGCHGKALNLKELVTLGCFHAKEVPPNKH